ncbi:restriction endonuclease subunit S [candidate division KSB1 bacterium]|nr:restriction endonuclease subunit S [bacterium]NUM68324.1 restriction endonuclease subunit S [candidate division KSB1 bacterium]
MGDVITETQYGTSNRADADVKGVAVIRMNNIDSQGRLDLSDLKYVNLEETELEKYLLEPGDLLFNRTNSRELVGKTGVWQGQMQAVPASYLIRFRVDRQRVFPECVWALMNTSFMKHILFDKARHAIGMANINAQELRTLPINIPSISVQREFVNVLTALEKISEHVKNANDRIVCLFQTLLHRAFSGDLTAEWREAHEKELLAEIEEQAKVLNARFQELSQ